MHCGSARASTITVAKRLIQSWCVTVRPDGSASEVILLLLITALLSRLRAFFRHDFRAQNDNTRVPQHTASCELDAEENSSTPHVETITFTFTHAYMPRATNTCLYMFWCATLSLYVMTSPAVSRPIMYTTFGQV